MRDLDTPLAGSRAIAAMLAPPKPVAAVLALADLTPGDLGEAIREAVYEHNDMDGPAWTYVGRDVLAFLADLAASRREASLREAC